MVAVHIEREYRADDRAQARFGHHAKAKWRKTTNRRKCETNDHVPQAGARLLAWAEARGVADGQWLGYQ